MWQDAFKGLEDDADEDLEISQMAELYKKQGGTILGRCYHNYTTNNEIVEFLPAPKHDIFCAHS